MKVTTSELEAAAAAQPPAQPAPEPKRVYRQTNEEITAPFRERIESLELQLAALGGEWENGERPAATDTGASFVSSTVKTRAADRLPPGSAALRSGLKRLSRMGLSSSRRANLGACLRLRLASSWKRFQRLRPFFRRLPRRERH
jgi:hypothetical protein